MTLSTVPPPALIAITGATEHTDFQTGESFYTITLRSPLRDKPVFIQVDRDAAFAVNQLVVEILSAVGAISPSSTQDPHPTPARNPQDDSQENRNPPGRNGVELHDDPNNADSAHLEEESNPYPSEEEDDSWKDDGRDPEPHYAIKDELDPSVLRIPRAQESRIPPAPTHASPRSESLPVRSKPAHANKPKRKPGLDSI